MREGVSVYFCEKDSRHFHLEHNYIYEFVDSISHYTSTFNIDIYISPALIYIYIYTYMNMQ